MEKTAGKNGRKIGEDGRNDRACTCVKGNFSLFYEKKLEKQSDYNTFSIFMIFFENFLKTRSFFYH